ncbi:unnamed protein product [Parajaminaea phylloscopi]
MAEHRTSQGGGSSSPPSQPNHARTARAPSADTATSLVPPTTAEDTRGLTALDLIAHQALLEAQAREAIPFSYTKAACTYEKGYIRQPLWACRDCNGINVCAGCSVGCHADHDLVELFAKRGSRCDCGAALSQDSKPCRLRTAPLNFVPENDGNTYTKNHQGHFCYCSRGWTYDPLEESECMFQCLVCEEWFHESCTSLRPAKMLQQASGQDGGEDRLGELTGPPPLISHENFDSLICDHCVRSHPILHHYLGKPQWGVCVEASLAQDDQSALPRMVVEDVHSDKHEFIVAGLSGNFEELASWKGAQIAPIESNGKRARLSPVSEGDEGDGADSSVKKARFDVEAQVDQQRTLTAGDVPSAIANPAKGTSVGDQSGSPEDGKFIAPAPAPHGKTQGGLDATIPRSPTCSLPPVDPWISAFLQATHSDRGQVTQNNPEGLQRLTGRLDVFLDEGGENEGLSDSATVRGWRHRLCRCSTCTMHLSRPELAGILQEEETYEPPASPPGEGNAERGGEGPDGDEDDAASTTSSSYDMAMSALSSLPRAQTLDALQGYARLKDALFEHLKPFAREGRVVDEASVRAFFDELKRT